MAKKAFAVTKNGVEMSQNALESHIFDLKSKTTKMSKSEKKMNQIQQSTSFLCQGIEAQATSITKAVMEAIQNAKDASRNTHTDIEVVVEPFFISIRDYGQGMSEAIIREVFATLGETTKSEEDIGGFGAGIMQAVNKSVFVLFTRNLKVEFDYRCNEKHSWDSIVNYRGEARNIGYSISKVDEIEGTLVEMHLYDECSVYDVVSELENAFVLRENDAKISINGKFIPIIPEDQIITIANFPDFYAFKADNTALYNQGIYVKEISFPYSLVGRGFQTILSRTELVHNNQTILLDRFKAHIMARDFSKKKRNAILKSSEVSHLLSVVNEGLLSLPEIENFQIFPTFDSESPSISFADFKKYHIYDYSNLKYRSSLEQYTTEEIESFCAQIRNNYGQTHQFVKTTYNLNRLMDCFNFEFSSLSILEQQVDMQKAIEAVVGSEQFITFQEIAKAIQLSAKGLTKLLEYMKFTLLMNQKISEWVEVDTRDLHFTKNHHKYNAQTDGCDFIRFNLSTIELSVRKSKKEEECMKIVQTLIHEYSHEADSSTDPHGKAFTAEYYRIMREAVVKGMMYALKTAKEVESELEDIMDMEELTYLDQKGQTKTILIPENE